MSKKQTASAEKIVYSYDPETKEYAGEYKCQKDPMNEGSFLIPANATETPPPETMLFRVAVFADGKWILQYDYRKRKVILLDTQEVVEIREIGELPNNAVLLSIDDEAELMQGKRARVDDDGNLEFYASLPTTEEQIATLERELTDTDWYIVRFAETGKEVPPEVTERRIELRGHISTLRKEV